MAPAATIHIKMIMLKLGYIGTYSAKIISMYLGWGNWAVKAMLSSRLMRWCSA